MKSLSAHSRRMQRPTSHVPLCDDSYRFLVLDDEEASDVFLDHGLQSLSYRCIRFYRYDSSRHHGSDFVLGFG